MSQNPSSQSGQRFFFGWLSDNQDPSNDEIAEVGFANYPGCFCNIRVITASLLVV